jgi:hypothetical protein
MRLSLYGLIWRTLPGPAPVKALIALILLAAAVWALFTWVFPQIADLMPFNDVTVDE